MKKNCVACNDATYVDKTGNPLKRGWTLKITGKKKPRKTYACQKHKWITTR